jgi:hypothetical protein
MARHKESHGRDRERLACRARRHVNLLSKQLVAISTMRAITIPGPSLQALLLPGVGSLYLVQSAEELYLHVHQGPFRHGFAHADMRLAYGVVHHGGQAVPRE